MKVDKKPFSSVVGRVKKLVSTCFVGVECIDSVGCFIGVEPGWDRVDMVDSHGKCESKNQKKCHPCRDEMRAIDETIEHIFFLFCMIEL